MWSETVGLRTSQVSDKKIGLGLGLAGRYVEPDVIRSLVHAFVTSHLDYCNGLLAGCNAYTVRCLQRVQNTAARLVLDVPHSSRSQPLLKNCIGCLSRAASSSNCFSRNCAVVLMRTVQAMYRQSTTLQIKRRLQYSTDSSPIYWQSFRRLSAICLELIANW